MSPHSMYLSNVFLKTWGCGHYHASVYQKNGRYREIDQIGVESGIYGTILGWEVSCKVGRFGADAPVGEPIRRKIAVNPKQKRFGR